MVCSTERASGSRIRPFIARCYSRARTLPRDFSLGLKEGAVQNTNKPGRVWGNKIEEIISCFLPKTMSNVT